MPTCYNQGVQQNRRRPGSLYSIIEYKLIPPPPIASPTRSRGLAQRPPRSLITPTPPGRAQLHGSMTRSQKCDASRCALQCLHHPTLQELFSVAVYFQTRARLSPATARVPCHVRVSGATDTCTLTLIH
jgi:hypothetical protein